MHDQPHPGQIARKLRKARRVPQRVIAEAVGCATATISDFETGRHLPSSAHVRGIEVALGLETGSLESDVERLRNQTDMRRTCARARGRKSHAAHVTQTLQQQLQDLIVLIDGLGRAPATVRDRELANRAVLDAEELLVQVTRDPSGDRRPIADALDRQASRLIELGHTKLRLRRGDLRARTGGWIEALSDHEAILGEQAAIAKVDAHQLYRSAVLLVNLGEYPEASIRLNALLEELPRPAPSSWLGRPEEPGERSLLSGHALHLLTWIADYEGDFATVDRHTSHLLGTRTSPGMAMRDRRLEGGVRHRLGRSLIERGAAVSESESFKRGQKLVRVGASHVKRGRSMIEGADKAEGAPLNPYGPLWEARADAVSGAPDTQAALDRQRAVAREQTVIAPHVILIYSRWRRNNNEPLSPSEITDIEVAIDQWHRQGYKRGGCDLFFEHGQALRRGGERSQAIDSLITSLELAGELGHSHRANAQGTLEAMGYGPNDPYLRQRAQELRHHDGRKRFFERYGRQLALPTSR